MRKLVSLLLFFCLALNFTTAQVGLNTTNPEAALDVNSTSSGVLLPRVELQSVTDNVTITNPNGGGDPIDGTIVWNTGDTISPAGFYYWEGGRWNQLLANNEQQVYFGKMIIDAAGTKTITGIPFRPKSVEFTAVNRMSKL